jgi:hypothetical protein
MFKWLLDNSLTNRLLVIIASLVVMAYGAFTLMQTPVDVFPDLNKPTVTLMTEAGGMAPEEVEQLITFPLENHHERPAWGWRACARCPAPGCPSSTSPSTGAPTSSGRGRWSRSA